jgi:hypothetical protein
MNEAVNLVPVLGDLLNRVRHLVLSGHDNHAHST